MQATKSLVTSKTFWIAVLQAVIGIIGIFSNTYPTTGWLLTLKSILDVVNRLYTDQPVGRIV